MNDDLNIYMEGKPPNICIQYVKKSWRKLNMNIIQSEANIRQHIAKTFTNNYEYFKRLIDTITVVRISTTYRSKTEENFTLFRHRKPSPGSDMTF